MPSGVVSYGRTLLLLLLSFYIRARCCCCCSNNINNSNATTTTTQTEWRVAASVPASSGPSRRRRPGQFAPQFILRSSILEPNNNLNNNDANNEHIRSEPERMTIANMTCRFFRQPWNHYELPRSSNNNNSTTTFPQRYCVYNGFILRSSRNRTNTANNTTHADTQDDTDNQTYPVFFYTGNESPLETYINHTGFLWEQARHFGAQVVFVEHRYEGLSVGDEPPNNNCMAYASSIQALADYARLIQHIVFSAAPPVWKASSTSSTTTTAPPRVRRRPVIAMGGSYGGMLAAWMRLRYPHLVAGAIAASAPIFGLPLAAVAGSDGINQKQNEDDAIRMDSAWRVIARGLAQPYPPVVGGGHRTEEEEEKNHCSTNLLAAWPLMRLLGTHETGRHVLSESFRLCRPLTSENNTSNEDDRVEALLEWASSPWFDLAEGSFPYPSNYIPYALTHRTIPLPAWPLQAACWKQGRLHEDLGVKFNTIKGTQRTGTDNDDDNDNDDRNFMTKVRYDISYGNLSIRVDWDNATTISLCTVEQLASSEVVANLLESVRNAVSIWFNVSQDVACYNVEEAAPNTVSNAKSSGSSVIDAQNSELGGSFSTAYQRRRRLSTGDVDLRNATAQCRDKIRAEGSWPSICCNEDMNLIITDARGLGQDIFWPPSLPRGVETYFQFVEYMNGTVTLPCDDPDGIFGYPQDASDPWSMWYDTVYGGRHISVASNIVFSNGLLDPWSAAGVYGTSPCSATTPFTDAEILYYKNVPGLMVQNVTKNDVLAVVMELGGHHTDLMYTNSTADPPCIREGRQVEQEAISRWINQFWDNDNMEK